MKKKSFTIITKDKCIEINGKEYEKPIWNVL